MFDRVFGRLRPATGFASVVLLAASLFSPFAPTALAASSPYSSGSVGYDVSYPNCSQSINPLASNGSTYSLAIVGVTGGRAFTSNGCLSQEFTTAEKATSTPSLYMNLNAPVGSTASEANKGPKSCKRNDKVCMSYNYGYQAALSAQSYATNQGATSSSWWLDIETGNSWSTNQSANFAVIQGAVAALTNNGTNTVNVGVYSTPSMWNKITGSSGAASPLPVWTAPGAKSLSDAANYCSASFTSGPVWLVQYSGGSYDEDYACLA